MWTRRVAPRAENRHGFHEIFFLIKSQVEPKHFVMKKPMSFIVLFVVLLLSVSAHTERVYEAAEGFKAPEFMIETGDTTLTLADHRGRYVLLNFWSSADAESRLATRRYDDMLGDSSATDQRLCLLSINFDRSERLFREIMRRDNLESKAHFHVSSADAGKLAEIYHLSHGYRSYLIDREGRIISVNPSGATIRKIISSR